MKKVRIIFDCRLKLWDFKQIFRESVLRTKLWKRSLMCLCTEAEIELARHAYQARVEEIK